MSFFLPGPLKIFTRAGKTRLCHFLRIFVATILLYSTLIPSEILAQIGTLTGAPPKAGLNLPVPGTMVNPTVGFVPPMILGLKVYPDNLFRFDFIVDTGETKIQGEELKAESTKLIKYFLAALTVPEDNLWVNLSPYEQDRIIPEKLGITEMGKDLLAQDYLLKQLTASLIYPEEELGKTFWNKIYQKAYDLYGTTNIPINTFNKVWIIPDKAAIYENKDVAFVMESHLKVMLEGDYIALSNNLNKEEIGTDKLPESQVKQLSDVSSQIVKEVIIPAIEEEVNTGKNFALLRQINNSLLLAVWYKKRLKESILGKVYVDKNKVSGVDVEDKAIKEKIYDQYVEAFKQGVYDYIKDDDDPFMGKSVKRRYVSGGMDYRQVSDTAQILSDNQMLKPVRNSFLQRLRNYANAVYLRVSLLVATPSFAQPPLIQQASIVLPQNIEELKQIQQFLKGDKGPLRIVSPQNRSSLGTDWKSYLKREKLLGAWLPPGGSPYFPYVKTKTLNSIEFVQDRIQPRYDEREINSEKGIENLIKGGVIDKRTAIILDSGGAHSVAMAVKLMKVGYQPVVMFNAVSHSKGSNRTAAQELATLLYFAEEAEKLKREGKFNANSPPVFILDSHRSEMVERNDIDNNYRYSLEDFPDGKKLKELGITKIVYLNEGDQDGKINPSHQSLDRLDVDLKSQAKGWESNGIKMIYTGVDPWPGVDPWEENFEEMFSGSPLSFVEKGEKFAKSAIFLPTGLNKYNFEPKEFFDFPKPKGKRENKTPHIIESIQEGQPKISAVLRKEAKKLIKASGVKPQEEAVVFQQNAVKITVSYSTLLEPTIFVYISSDTTESFLISLVADTQGNISEISGRSPSQKELNAVILENVTHPLIDELKKVLQLPKVDEDVKERLNNQDEAKYPPQDLLWQGPWWKKPEYTNPQFFEMNKRSIERGERVAKKDKVTVQDIYTTLTPKTDYYNGVPHFLNFDQDLPKDLVLIGRFGDSLDRDSTVYVNAKEMLGKMSTQEMQHTLFINFTGHAGAVGAVLAEKNIPIYWQIKTRGVGSERVLNMIRDYDEKFKNNTFQNTSNLAIMFEPPHDLRDVGVKIESLPMPEYLKTKGIKRIVVFTEDPYIRKPHALETSYRYDENIFFRYLDILNSSGFDVIPIGVASWEGRDLKGQGSIQEGELENLRNLMDAREKTEIGIDFKNTYEDTVGVFKEVLGADFDENDAPKLKSSADQAIPVDRASIEDQKNPGGIDLNPTNLDLQIKGEGMDFNLFYDCPEGTVQFNADTCTPRNSEQLQNLPIPGFYPVILNVVPVTNLPFILGISAEDEGEEDNPAVSFQRSPAIRESGYELATVP